MLLFELVELFPSSLIAEEEHDDGDDDIAAAVSRLFERLFIIAS